MIINYDINNKGGGASAEGCLRYDEAQDLTTEQQAQAKENLGIEDPEPQAAVLYDQEQELTYVQKQQARTNIGAASLSDTVGWVGYNMEQILTPSQQHRARMNIGAEAPRDGKTYGRCDWQWVEIEGGGESIIVEIYFDWGVGKQVKRTDLEAAIQKHMNNGAPIVLHFSDSASGIYSDSYELVVYVSSASTGFQFVISQGLNGSYNKYMIDQSSGTWITPEHYSIQADWNEADTSKPSFINNKPTIPQPENHQLLKSALSEPMGCSANTWATLAELTVPEDGAYQVSASARMLPADQSTAFKTATVSIELGTDAAGYTEVMEMTLPRSGEYGTLSVPVNASNGQKLRLRAISEANFYAQASPSAGKASATFIAAVRVGAIYQAQ